MSAKIVNFPVEKTYPKAVDGKEVWDQQEPPPEMVWAMCPYTDGRLSDCRHCPKWLTDEDGDTVSRGCYVFAAEACRVVFAMQARSAALTIGTLPQT